MAKGYHVLAGLCRDLRNAAGDAAAGSETAAKLVDEFNDLLDILDEGSFDEDAGGESDDDDGSGDAATDEDVPVPRGTGKGERQGVAGVGTGGQGPTQHSTRARMRQEARPVRSRGELAESGKVRYPAGTRNGGKR